MVSADPPTFSGSLAHPRLSPISGAELERAGLIASDNTRCLRSGASQWHGEPGRPREISAAGNWEEHGHLGHVVGRLRRKDQQGAAARLLMPFRGICPDQPGSTSLHQTSSVPAGGTTGVAVLAACSTTNPIALLG